MKKHRQALITAILFFAIAGGGFFLLMGPQNAEACGYGNSGGRDYVPQRRGLSGDSAKSALTEEQAREIVANHIARLNPDLEVGEINDAGRFFEAEILSQDEEIIQLLGVDKFSGRLILLG
jgi:hypothetical protein